DLVETHALRRFDVNGHRHLQSGRIAWRQMAHRKKIGRVGTGEAVADEVGGLPIKRGAAHEFDKRVRIQIQWRNYLIRIRARSVLEERSPLYLSTRSIIGTAVTDRVRQDRPSFGWFVFQCI